MSSWSRAFEKAIEVEREGAQYFSDLSNKPVSNTLDDDNEVGGFCQPSKLSKFMKRRTRAQDDDVKNTRILSADPNTDVDNITADNNSHKRKRPEDSENPQPSSPRNIDNDEDDNIPVTSAKQEKKARNMDEVLGGQVCRTWLKNHYLRIGAACNNLCKRKHVVDGKPENLYSDFSFKGLRKNHQQSILAAIRSERQSASSS